MKRKIMMKDKDFEDLPPDLKSIIEANGQAMNNFYGLPPEERERLLDSVSNTNKRLNRPKKPQ